MTEWRGIGEAVRRWTAGALAGNVQNKACALRVWVDLWVEYGIRGEKPVDTSLAPASLRALLLPGSIGVLGGFFN